MPKGTCVLVAAGAVQMVDLVISGLVGGLYLYEDPETTCDTTNHALALWHVTNAFVGIGMLILGFLLFMCWGEEDVDYGGGFYYGLAGLVLSCVWGVWDLAWVAFGIRTLAVTSCADEPLGWWTLFSLLYHFLALTFVLFYLHVPWENFGLKHRPRRRRRLSSV